MTRQCDLCGKKVSVGNQISRRGRAKYLGGVGVKTTGISKRKFIPNLQKVRHQTANGTVMRKTVCTQCIRSGKITKPVRRPKIEPKVKADPKAKATAKAKVKA